MMNIPFLILVCGIVSAQSVDVFLSDDVRYNQAAYVTAHNSFAAVEHGYLVPQQVWSISNQLKNGVRALMFDIYLDEGLLGVKDEYIGLCHGSCFSTRYVLTVPGTGVMSLAKALRKVKKFLEEHPKEIVTIFLEDYVKDRIKLDKVIDEVQIGHFVLRPCDWDPIQNNGWPTIQQMRERNKRLVIFTDKRPTASALGGGVKLGNTASRDNSYAYYIWSNVMESEFSTLQKEKIALEREQSRNNATSTVNISGRRFLYLMNYYPEFYLPLKIDEFTCEELKNRFDYSRMNSRGLLDVLSYVMSQNNGRYPNFIALDFVQAGDPLHIVQGINQHAAQATSAERDRLFAAITA